MDILHTPVGMSSAALYHWQELPQVSFLSRQKFCLNKHGFVIANTCLFQQNMSFVATKVCLLRQNFCRDKIVFVVTKYFCCDKTMFVATKYFCCDKTCRDKHTFVWVYVCVHVHVHACTRMFIMCILILKCCVLPSLFSRGFSQFALTSPYNLMS